MLESLSSRARQCRADVLYALGGGRAVPLANLPLFLALPHCLAPVHPSPLTWGLILGGGQRGAGRLRRAEGALRHGAVHTCE